MNHIPDRFQTFEVTGGPDYGRRNLPKLRKEMEKLGLDAFLVPHEDEYQNEYLPDCNERLMWVSGFTGSAGAAIILRDKAVLFVDGRYTLQSKQQVDDTLFDFTKYEGVAVSSWLKDNIQTGQLVGFDPRLHSPSALSRIKDAIDFAGGEIKSLDQNPIDLAWEDRPAVPLTQVTIQDKALAGKTHKEKRGEIGRAIGASGADAALITAPASIAWLLNIRGADVQCTPLPLSTAIIDADGQTQLFIAPEKLSDPIRKHLGNEVSLQPENALEAAMKALKGCLLYTSPSPRDS